MGDFRPCPFCGGDNVEQGWDEHLPPVTWVECCDCGAHGPSHESWNDAVVAWDTQQAEQLEAKLARVEGLPTQTVEVHWREQQGNSFRGGFRKAEVVLNDDLKAALK